MVEFINNKISFSEKTLSVALSDFINSNKRQDRDRVIKLKSRIETYNEILKELKKCK